MRRHAIVPAVAISVLAAGCVRGTEQLLLEQFFQASRLRDRTALERVATVIFEPLEQGTVTDFTIDAVVELQEKPAAVSVRQATVSAPVRLPNGETARKKIVLLLEKRDRWIVTGFTVLPERSGR